MSKTIQKCICGEQEIFGGADVEIGDICHCAKNPCYVIEKAKTLNNEPISKELQKKIDNNFSKYIGKVELIEKMREEIKAEILSKLPEKADEEILDEKEMLREAINNRNLDNFF